MARSSISHVVPCEGPVDGGILVDIHGVELGAAVLVQFGAHAVPVQRRNATGSILSVRLPGHDAGAVDLTLVDATGNIVASAADKFRFHRAQLAQESDLTRTVRSLLISLRRNVMINTSLSASVDYHGSTLEGMDAVRVAELPSIVVTGPRIDRDPLRSGMADREEVVDSENGDRVIRYPPAHAVTLGFSITCAARTTVELLNFISGVTKYLSRTHWLEVRDESGVSLGRLEMHPDGELRTHLDVGDDIRAFTCGLLLCGLNMSSDEATDLLPSPTNIELQTERLNGGTGP